MRECHRSCLRSGRRGAAVSSTAAKPFSWIVTYRPVYLKGTPICRSDASSPDALVCSDHPLRFDTSFPFSKKKNPGLCAKSTSFQSLSSNAVDSGWSGKKPFHSFKSEALKGSDELCNHTAFPSL